MVSVPVWQPQAAVLLSIVAVLKVARLFPHKKTVIHLWARLSFLRPLLMKRADLFIGLFLI